MNDFFSFRSMITPVLIQGLFGAGTILWVIATLGGIGLTVFGGLLGAAAQGGSAEAGGGLLAVAFVVLSSVVIAMLGLLLFRLYCEMIILFFRVNQTLQEISTKLDRT